MNYLMENVLKQYQDVINDSKDFDFALICYAVEKIAIHLIENNLGNESINAAMFENVIYNAFSDTDITDNSEIHATIDIFYNKYDIKIITDGNPMKYFKVKDYKVGKRNVIINDLTND